MIALTVHGVPAPQGSKTAYVRGEHAVVVEGSSKSGRAKHAAWRQAVATAARDHLDAGGPVAPDGALTVTMLFRFVRPKSRRKTERWVTTKPDIDKLIRSTLDGLVDGGVVFADQRVAEVIARKTYVSDGQPSGCWVGVFSCLEET